MVIKAGSGNLLSQRFAQFADVGHRPRRDPHHDNARNREILELQSTAQPWLEQTRRFLPGIGLDVRDAGESPGNGRGFGDIHLHVTAGCRPNLDGHLARDAGLPFQRRRAHQRHRANGQRSKEGHDGDNADERPGGNCRLRHNGRLPTRRSPRRCRRGISIGGRWRMALLHERITHRHAGTPHAARGGVRQTDPSMRCRVSR